MREIKNRSKGQIVVGVRGNLMCFIREASTERGFGFFSEGVYFHYGIYTLKSPYAPNGRENSLRPL